MAAPKFEVGDTLSTVACGNCKVTDRFISQETPVRWVYEVEVESKEKFVYLETDLE